MTESALGCLNVAAQPLFDVTFNDMPVCVISILQVLQSPAFEPICCHFTCNKHQKVHGTHHHYHYGCISASYLIASQP
ncbi:hypothetical protein J8J20_23920, partial [Mycobacterium tuberculosis]|nr:hypothetical protein [Mycobacterium tuberculosis]